MIESIKRSIKILDISSTTKNDLSMNHPIIEEIKETYNERPALTGSRGKVSGVTKVY